MRSPVGALVRAATTRSNGNAPVPYVGRHASTLSLPGIFGINPRGQESQMRAMGSMGTLFAIVNSLAEATSQVEWHLYRKAASGDPDEREEVTSHAALDMWNNPNDFMERAEFIETFQQHYDLVGEAWWVVESHPRFKVPLHLWPVRPDRMQPVPHPQKFLTGYVYTGPDGEQVPLTKDEVIFMRRPNPLDIYRGMGPVQTVMADIDSDRYSAEWNRNFFLNSAEPGGIIEFPEGLSDEDYTRLRDRWAEQHKGVAQAHRVALLEAGGKWVERKYTNRDMQFKELREVPGEKVREAFAYPKPMLGSVDDVNRANMEAANTIFAQWKSVPRLNRIRTTLNGKLLPMFGATARDHEWDYDSPVPEDREADDRELKAKTEAYKILRDAGVHPDDAADAVGLPRMRVTLARPAEQPPAAEPADEDEEFEAIAARLRGELGHRPLRAIEAAAPDHSTGCMLALHPPVDVAEQLAVPGGLPAGELHLTVAYCGKAVDVDADALMAAARTVSRRDPISANISGLARFVGGEDGDCIVALVDSPGLEDLRRDVRDRLAEQGIDIPRDHGFTPHITLTYLDPGAASPVEEIDNTPIEFGALSMVHGVDRADYEFDGPAEPMGPQVDNAMRWVAKCENDDNSCQPCKDNDGQLYRNRGDAYDDYPGGEGYVRCEGRSNCRCRVVKRRKGDA